MTSEHHVAGQRVRSIFDDREGVVVESDPVKTLIEFQDYDEAEGAPFTHRKWLPTRHWQSTDGI